MNTGDNADHFLVEQIREGSESAWRMLIDRYTGRLLAFARARTSSLSDAEDIVQETFVGFLQSAAGFDTSRSLETYLFTILRYKLYDLLRQRKVTILREPAGAEDWWDHIMPGDEETPSGIAVQAEVQGQQEKLLGEMLLRLIHELRDREAFSDLQVIELVFFAGKRNLDVAELLEIDQKAVAGIKFRAIQKLQKFLGECEPEAVACLDETQDAPSVGASPFAGYSPSAGASPFAGADITVARVWRERRLTCLKRSTLGSFLLGVLDEPWRSYTQFHLDVVACPMCVANLGDLEAGEDGGGPLQERSPEDNEAMFQSSVGFLKRTT